MWFHRTVGAAWLVLVLSAIGGPFWASPSLAGDVFTVRGIPVDVTAETAASAREAAHAEGHAMAMETLLTRLLPRAERTRTPPLETAQIVDLVKDFEVADERTSNVRYLAKLTFRFKPGAVRKFLRSYGLGHAETRSKPVVVLPVHGPTGEARLWEDDNPWLAAWATQPPGDWLVPLIVPLGDLADILAVNAEQALGSDLERLSRLADRYRAEDVLVTHAIPFVDPESGELTLDVATMRLGPLQQNRVIVSFVQGPEETLLALYRRAAEAIDVELQETWKQRNLLHPGAARRISVAVPYRDLAEWLEVKSRLAGVAGVQRSDVSLLSRSRSELDITFVGDEAQLVLAMAQSDLTLSFDEDAGWRLQISEARPSATATADSAPDSGSAVQGEPLPGAGPATPEPSATERE